MKSMGSIRPKLFGHRRSSASHQRGAWLLAAMLACFAAACHHEPQLDTKPLEAAGYSYSAIQELKALNITGAEVGEAATARQGGLSEEGCVSLVRLYHQRGKPFNVGAAAGNFAAAGMREDRVLELAALDQLGLGSGELQAMRLAGLSDEIVLEVARHRAAGKQVLSGASLAGMRNVGLRNTTIFELIRRDVPESQANSVIALRRRGASDAEVLRRF
jgi:hypothetical protein